MKQAAKMKLNLNKKLTQLDGTILTDNGQDVYLCKLLAGRLSENVTGIPALKAYDWAKQLWNTGEIEIDRTDLTKLQEFVESSQLFVFVKAQIIEIILKILNETN
jgi:hypothetical protein